MSRTLRTCALACAIAACAASASVTSDVQTMLSILRAQEVVPKPASELPATCPAWFRNDTLGSETVLDQVRQLDDEAALQEFASAYGDYFAGGFNVSYYLSLWRSHDHEGSYDLGSLSGWVPAAPTTSGAPMTSAMPTTAMPTTAMPTTAMPTTGMTTTAMPTTAMPTTAMPTTAMPTTAMPTTAMPTTAMPTTAMPTTAMPTTAMPTTAMPTTAMPTTAMPTTAVPTTAVPTTAVPTTAAALRAAHRRLLAVAGGEDEAEEILKHNLIKLLVVEDRIRRQYPGCVTARHPAATLPPQIVTTTTGAPTTGAGNVTSGPNVTGTATGTGASTTTTTAPVTTTTPAPTNPEISFPLPPIDNAAFESDAVYRAIYEVAASNRIQVAFPLNNQCPDFLATAETAIAAFDDAELALTDIPSLVSTFLASHPIAGFNKTDFINFFNAHPVQAVPAKAARRNSVKAAILIARVAASAIVGNASNSTAASSTTANPNTVAPTTTPAPTMDPAVMYLELALMRHVVVRMQWTEAYPVCFVALTAAPTGTLAPGATPSPMTTAAPVTARVFSATIEDPTTFNVDLFRAGLTRYFEAQGTYGANFTVEVKGNKVVVTIIGSGEVAALAAANMEAMPEGEQASLGIKGLAAEDTGNGDDDKKKFPMWVIGVIVGGIIVLVVVGLVVSRRSAARGTGSTSQTNVNALESELRGTPNAGYQAV